MKTNLRMLRKAIAAAFLLTISFAAWPQQTRIPLQMDKVPVEQVLDKIEELSDYVFLYNESELDKNRIVSVTVKSVQITDILNEIFRGTDVTWTIVDRQVMLSVRKNRTDDKKTAQVTISGIVYDDSGEPIIGAGVMLKGTATGTITDIDGAFSLNVPEGGVIEVSSLGFVPAEFKAGPDFKGTVTLHPDTVNYI